MAVRPMAGQTLRTVLCPGLALGLGACAGSGLRDLISGSGESPNYTLHSGPGKLWVIGYPWALASVTDSNPPGMTRADMLLNLLAWLMK